MRKALLLGVVLALAFTGAAYAQESTSGTIAGQVLDPQGAAVPGATVTLITPTGDRTYTTDAEGRFIAPFLDPGMYDVRVELTGFKTVEQKGIMVRLGQRSRLSFTLAVSQVQETVEVVGASPVVDLSSTTAGTVMDNELLKNLPVGRTFTQALYLAPGVSSSGSVGSNNPSIGGGSGLENQYIIDGVNITDSGYGGIGSYSIVFGSLGNGVTTDFIEETQVKTAGYEAEYGAATGGVVNVVTKSGTNQFHGSVYGFWRGKDLEADRDLLLDAPETIINTTGAQASDIGATLGGPLVKDKLFFFGAFNPRWTTRTAASAGEGVELQGREFDRDRRTMSYAAKLSWQASANHRFDVSAFGDPSDGFLGPQRLSALRGGLLPDGELERASEMTYGGNNYTARYDGVLSPNWFIEGSVSRMKNEITETPYIDEWNVRDTTVTPFAFSGGIGFFEAGSESSSWQYALKSTNVFDAGGQHQLRYGVQYEDVEYTDLRSRTGPPFTLSDGQQTASGASLDVIPAPEVPAGKIWRVGRAFLQKGRTTTQKYLSFFAQDTWQLGSRLTLKLGVRYEQQKLEGDAENPLCSEGESFPGANDGPTPNNMPCSYQWDNNWAPRLGVIYDILGDGRSKLYAHWGRFFAKIPNDLAVRAMSGDSAATRADYYDAGLSNPVPEGVLAAGTTTHLIFNPGGASYFGTGSDAPKSTYKNEFVGGFEFEAVQGLNLGVRYTYRDMPRIVEDIGTVGLSQWIVNTAETAEIFNYFFTNPGPNSPVDLPDDPRISFEDPVHHYHAVEVTANRVFSGGWGLVASYRWSKLEGTFEGFFRNDNGQSDPALTSLYDFPTNDPTYTEDSERFGLGFRGDIRYQGTLGTGFLPNDRTHQLKIWGSKAVGNLNLGVGLVAGSGAPLTEMAANAAYNNGGEIPEGPRGSGIQTVDGFKERTPFITTLDMHLDYRFQFNDGRQSITLIADAINLFNNQDPTNYDYGSETSFGVFNPNGPESAAGGQPVTSYGSPYPSFFAPRQIRFGARFEF